MIEHIAFGIESGGRLLASYTCEDEQSAREMADLFAASGVSVNVVPLYRQPAMTDADREAVEWYAAWVREVVPLYRSPTLTDAEREFLQNLRGAYEELANQMGYVNAAAQKEAREHAATLRGLLERMK